MGLSCKGVCHRYKINRINGTGRYCIGQKRCNLCDMFMLWDGIFCPCCGGRLRLKPRNTKYKQKFFEAIRHRDVNVMGRI